MADGLRPSTNFVDLTGYKCGALRAVRPVGKDRHGHYLWECVCEKCGKKKVVNYVQFREGSMRDCGCTPARGYDITGQEKGHLTAIMPVGHDKEEASHLGGQVRHLPQEVDHDGYELCQKRTP